MRPAPTCHGQRFWPSSLFQQARMAGSVGEVYLIFVGAILQQPVRGSAQPLFYCQRAIFYIAKSKNIFIIELVPRCARVLFWDKKRKKKTMSSSAKSLTEGPLAKQILLVSLPLVLSNLLQVLFNMSDVAVVGRFAGSTALGSVGSTSIFVTLFTGFLIGLSNGINVLVARFYGARHADDVEKTVHSALLVSLAAGRTAPAHRPAGFSGPAPSAQHQRRPLPRRRALPAGVLPRYAGAGSL